MDIEQLKLILETVNAATGGAKEIAIAWLVLGFLKPIIILILILVAIIFLVKTIAKAVYNYSTAASFLLAVAKKHDMQVVSYEGGFNENVVFRLKQKLGVDW